MEDLAAGVTEERHPIEYYDVAIVTIFVHEMGTGLITWNNKNYIIILGVEKKAVTPSELKKYLSERYYSFFSSNFAIGSDTSIVSLPILILFFFIFSSKGG